MTDMETLSQAIRDITACGDCDWCCKEFEPEQVPIVTASDPASLQRFVEKRSDGKSYLLLNSDRSCVFYKKTEKACLCTIHSTIGATIDGEHAEPPKDCQFFPFYLHRDGYIVMIGSCAHAGDIMRRVVDRDQETLRNLAIVKELLPKLSEPEISEQLYARAWDFEIRIPIAS